MTGNLRSLLWISEGGRQWLEANDSPTFCSLVDTGLFLDFAELLPEQVDSFLESYGVDIQQAQAIKELWTIKQAVRIWSLLRQGDKVTLKRYIRSLRDGEGRGYLEYDSRADMKEDWHQGFPGTKQIIASNDKNPAWVELLRGGYPELPAMAYLQLEINERLRGQIEPLLLFDVKQKKLAWQSVPLKFLDAIWLQFGLAVAESKEYRRCLVCFKHFEVSPETARTNRRFCSNACRNKMYRKRQQIAQKLHSQGMPVKAIARELDSDIEAVRGWISKASD